VTRARIVTLNLWGTGGPTLRRLEVAARGLAAVNPTVICLQEVRVGEGLVNTATQLARFLGAGWHVAYACATRGEAGTFGPGSTAGEEGLALLAREPIDEQRDLPLPDARPDERRILLSGRIVLPGGAVLWAHTTHLHWRLGDGLARERQIVAIDEAIRAIEDPGAVHVLAGDFNCAPEHDEIRFMTGKHTLAGRRTVWQDAWAVAGKGDGVTWTARNPYTAPLGWLAMERRIDYVFVGAERSTKQVGRGRIHEARLCCDEPDVDGVWASDHLGVVAEIEL
jgi:endonuclease/exonuclease/phosphatase family metal-dependent hydrolase